MLGRVRTVMAATGTAQERLDQIVQVIALEMVAEVCSIYLRRAGDVLELFATQGLRKDAVHKTRLRIGEGLVGEIAAHALPFALEDAQSHPSFAYRPETGEELFHSLMGVPILRGGRVTGVLVVQNRTRRAYEDEEVETLQTVAMVLAELVAGGDLVAADELLPVDGIGLKPLRVEGLKLNGGIGIGVAVLHRPHLFIERIVADDPAAERQRLHQAFKAMHGALDDMLASDNVAKGGEHRDILETYRLIAQDAGWLSRIEDAILTGLSAEAAVQRVQNDLRARMTGIDDPYLRERAHDLDDLGYRLTQHLMGSEPGPRKMPDNAILIARNMGPAQLLDYDSEKLRGLVLAEGSPNAHVAIVARALDLPVVGRLDNILDRVEEGDPLIIDGDHGQVYLRPGEDIRITFEDSQRLRAEQRAQYAVLKDAPSVTRDGVAVNLLLNAGLRVDLMHLEHTGAVGIGLFRTEIPFMVEAETPTVDRQQEIYATVYESAGDRPVTFRTLDAGGDKVLPYWDAETAEENPAMGWRAIRVSLDRPALMRDQLRSLIRAAAGKTLRIMFPMVSEVAEFDRAKRLLDAELIRARRRGHVPPSEVRAGVMLEVPGLIFQLPALTKRVDFISVGSNDMMQFLFAADRGNPLVASRYDDLAPAAINFLGQVARHCAETRTELSLCGEMAGDPLAAMTLIGLGYRNLSMSAPSIGPVKAMVRSLDVGALESYLSGLAQSPAHSLREKLRAFAADHGVMV
ncbi:MAG: phosphoenolpyruvate--protein phosphotransferase [Rhodospirillaceae bacterium]|nr:phosphoenolpyruvate--protein phosphotransferase [Rhodospirillaceae bacterium]